MKISFVLFIMLVAVAGAEEKEKCSSHREPVSLIGRSFCSPAANAQTPCTDTCFNSALFLLCFYFVHTCMLVYHKAHKNTSYICALTHTSYVFVRSLARRSLARTSQQAMRMHIIVNT